MSCKQKVPGSILGGGMKALATAVILARQLGLGQKGRLLLLYQKNAVIIINNSLLSFVSYILN